MNLFKLAKNLTLFAFVAGIPAAFASPLALDYSVTADGGLYHYDFTLTVDNHDGSFAAGNGFGWLVFGDAKWDLISPVNPTSPIEDFVMDAGQFPVGPWASFSTSSGYHNGPSLIFDSGFNVVHWTPTSVGDFVTWSGVSANDVADGSLLFSTLENNGGAVGADFEVATRIVTSVPESGTTVAMLGVALLGLATLPRRISR